MKTNSEPKFDSARWQKTLAEYGETAIPLNVAEMDIPAPPAVINQITNRAKTGFYWYVEFPQKTLKTISAWLEKRYQWKVPANNILFVRRVIKCLPHLIKILTQPGEKIVVPTPSYGPISNIIEPNNRELVRVPLKNVAGHYQLDFPAIETAFRNGAKVFILINPHNPTGRCWNEEELKHLSELAKKYRVWIISDDFHSEMIYAPHNYTPIAKYYDKVITFNSPAKPFNLAGLEVAYAIISNQEVRELLAEQMRKSGKFNPPFFSATAIETVYTDPTCLEWLDNLKQLLEKNLSFLRNNLPEGARLIEPEGTYLVWLDLRNWGNESALVEKIFQQQKLVLGTGSAFGPGNDGFMRISLATPQHTFKEAISRLNAAQPQERQHNET